jgi:methyltransferase (TIGR00027 family)
MELQSIHALLRAMLPSGLKVAGMKDNKASTTALGVSYIRAVHQKVDELPHILEDPVSPLLLDQDTLQKIEREPEGHSSPQARALRSHVVLRSRYAEDRLFSSFQSGVRQYISLGAGYDTFSCRQPEWARDLKIMEVDHPATQSAKIAHFQLKRIVFPENVEFLPLDLEKNTLWEALSHSTIDFSLPTFVSCLGVLAYLKYETVRSIFESIAGMPEGSSLVFAFALNRTETPESGGEQTSTAQRAAAHGEPWLTRFELGGLRKELIDCGFRKVSFLQTSEAAEQYYIGRKDLPAPRKIRLCEAVV